MPYLSTFESPYYRRTMGATYAPAVDLFRAAYDARPVVYQAADEIKKVVAAVNDILPRVTSSADLAPVVEYIQKGTNPRDDMNLNANKTFYANMAKNIKGMIARYFTNKRVQETTSGGDAAARAAAYAAAENAERFRISQAAEAAAAASEQSRARAAAIESGVIEPGEPVETSEPPVVDVGDAITAAEIDRAELLTAEAENARTTADIMADYAAAGVVSYADAAAAEAYATQKETEITENTVLNKILPLTLAAGLFIFFWKRKK